MKKILHRYFDYAKNVSAWTLVATVLALGFQWAIAIGFDTDSAILILAALCVCAMAALLYHRLTQVQNDLRDVEKEQHETAATLMRLVQPRKKHSMRTHHKPMFFQHKN